MSEMRIDGVPVVAGERKVWSARDLGSTEEPQNGVYVVEPDDAAVGRDE